jgi:hypothetical protein
MLSAAMFVKHLPVFACRTGVYAGHRAAVLQMLVLGDNLLSLGKDRQLLVWKIGQYDAPQVRVTRKTAAQSWQGLQERLLKAALA